MGDAGWLSKVARVVPICALSVAFICTTFPAPAALARPATELLLAQAYPPPPVYSGPATGYPPPPAYAVPPTVAPTTDAEHGATDGQGDADANLSAAGWFCAGFFLSWIGIVLGYALRPSIDGARLVGRSSTYVSSYTDAYQTEGRSYRGIHAVYGCVTSGIIVLALTVALFALVAATSSVGTVHG